MKTTPTTQDIIDHLTNNCGLQRSSAIRAVDGTLNLLSSSLAAGMHVTLRGFGTLRVCHVAERIGRNMVTGTPITIPAHRTVRLIPSNELKQSLNPKTEK